MTRRTPPVEIIGHRGFAARAPENTVASLRLALDAGADAVEFDVRTTACGTPVLFHDAELDRTTDGTGSLADHDLAALRRLDAGSWFSEDFVGEPLPTLAEALDAVRGRARRVYCEVKGYGAPRDLTTMVEVARRSALLDDVVFISLDFGTVDRMAAEGVSIGYVVSEADAVSDALRRIELHGRGLVDARASLILDDPSLTEPVLAADVDLAVWTVNDPDEAAALSGAGVTGFTTDEVAALVAWRRTLRSGNVPRSSPRTGRG